MSWLPRGIERGMLRYGTEVEALVALACLRVGVAVGLPWLARRAFRAEDGEAVAPPALTQRIAAAIEQASRWLPGETRCLPRALAGKWMLERRGWPATVRLGVAHQHDGSLRAHAWLVVGGAVLIGEAGVAGLTPLPTGSLPAGSWSR